MPKPNRQRLGLTAMRIARVILGASLLLSILSVNIPTALVASAPMCTLACCAGRVPHAAGSCMNGSCHAFLKGRAGAPHIHHQSPVQRAEQLCGLPLFTARTKARLLRQSARLTVGDSSERFNADRASDAARVSTSTIGQPCQPDCGAGTFSSSSQNRPRDTSATAYADKPRPPSASRHEHSSSNRAMALDALCRRSRPRGPPNFSS